MRNERIGDYLVSQGLISEEQLQKEHLLSTISA